MHHHHGRQEVNRARTLRSGATDSEKALWYKLRELKHLGYRIRRQSPFRNYTLDFVEHGAKLVIELDGSQHALPDHARKDEKRDALLTDEGYRVLRFWNSEIAENVDGVV
ncbi:MAG TPA: endonuclease domain-containing protein, partial [Rhizomicrobium sp.]|nr:endonuclease domain-containing protein [Rhizomicrobium sp.]